MTVFKSKWNNENHSDMSQGWASCGEKIDFYEVRDSETLDTIAFSSQRGMCLGNVVLWLRIKSWVSVPTNGSTYVKLFPNVDLSPKYKSKYKWEKALPDFSVHVSNRTFLCLDIISNRYTSHWEPEGREKMLHLICSAQSPHL